MHFETPISRIAHRLRMSRLQTDGSTFIDAAVGTGSYWSVGDDWYLITNWHNITGCNPITHEAMSKNTGVIPTHLTHQWIEIDDLEKSPEQQKVMWKAFAVQLYEEDNKPLWFEHPKFGHKVDVVAIKVFEGRHDKRNIFSLPVNDNQWFALNILPGSDCFVLGYPKGLDGGFDLPLWKRASIASEPSYDHGGLPRLLIDTATREGMSGAPVVAVSNGYHVPIGGTGFKDSVIGRVESFIGVYSGRMDDDPLGVQIGIVWKEKLINEIIQGSVRGSNPLIP